MAFLDYEGLSRFKSNLDTVLADKADLDSAGKVPASQLPSYVDDVLEYASMANFPAIGESGKIYIALDTNKTYRWGGSTYVEISNPDIMTGATANANGTAGLVPAPLAGEQDKLLVGNGTWQYVSAASKTYVLDTVTNTSGSYTHNTSLSDVTSDMKAISLELSNPEVFLDKINVYCHDGYITLSCNSVAGTSSASVTVLKQARGQDVEITTAEFDVIAARVGLENAGEDISLTIASSSWSNTSPYTYTWESSKVTTQCRIMVDFDDDSANVNVPYITYEKVEGGVEFTAPVKPTQAVKVVIHIIQDYATRVLDIDDETVSSNTIAGASNVKQALTVLNNNIVRITPTNTGTTGQILRKNSSGGCEWDNAATQQEIGTAVTNWLDTYVAPVGTTVVVDKTLTVANAAAEAKATGDKITHLESALNFVYECNNIADGVELFIGKFFNGSYSDNASFNATDYCPAKPNKTYKVTRGDPASAYLVSNVFACNSSKTSLGACSYDSTNYTFTTPTDTAFVVFNFTSAKTTLDDFLAVPTGETYKKGVIGQNIVDGSVNISALDTATQGKINNPVSVKSIEDGVKTVECVPIYSQYLNANGSISTGADSSFYTTDYVEIPNETTHISIYEVAPFRNATVEKSVYFYDKDKTPISSLNKFEIDKTDIPQNAAYLIASGYKELPNANKTIKFYMGEINERINNPSYLEYRYKDILVDKTIIPNKTLTLAGSAAGNLENSSLFFVTAYMEVEENTAYAVNAGDPFIASNTGNICFYDADKRFISNQASVWKTFTTPNNAKYARFAIYYDTFNNESMNGITVTKGTVPKPVNNYPYIKNNITGKKWTVIGDSITAFATNPIEFGSNRAAINYHQYVAADLGLEVVNAGVSGSGYKQHDSSGGLMDAFYLRVVKQEDDEYVIDLDADVITIMGGVNDVLFGQPIGVYTDTTSDTVCGCVNLTIDRIIARKDYKYAPIGIISPLPCAYQGTADYPTQLPSDPDCRMQTFVMELAKICKMRGIPFLDLFHQSNFNPSDADFRAKYTSCHGTVNGDGLHPNQHGHKLFYRQIEEFVRAIIAG